MTTPSGSMILSPVPEGLLAIIGPVALPHQLLVALRLPEWPPGVSSRPATELPTMQFVCAVTPVLGPTEKGSSTLIPRVPFFRMLLFIAMLLLPPKRRTGPFSAVEPMLVLPLIVLFVTPPRTNLSGVPPTSSLLEIVILVSLPPKSLINTELFECPLNLFPSIVALLRPKLT